ncbi:MAG: Ribonuclease BN [Methanothrix sp.]|jgi:YihY family inner membrane protein|nr:MAG: Ribonuclease BN [Methanothrix sp.]
MTERLKERIKAVGRDLFIRADDFSRGSLGVSIGALRSFNDARGSEAAAALAYYALFSLFPLFIIVVVLTSTLLQNREVQGQIYNLVGEVLPPGEDLARDSVRRITELGGVPPVEEFFRDNLDEVMRLRVPAGIAAALGLVWASTSVFMALARNVDRAWSGTAPRDYLRWRILGFTMAGGLTAGLLVVSLSLAVIFRLLSQLQADGPPLYGGWLARALTDLVPIILVFLITFLLYLLAPNAYVRRSEAAWGAVVATLGWTATRVAFTWYLDTWPARWQLVYGSLGTVVALMLWIYLSGMIVLYGAHLSSFLGQRRRLRSDEK